MEPMDKPLLRVALTISAAFAFVATGLAHAKASEERFTERYQFATDDEVVDDGDTVQTYTPTLPAPGGDAEIVIRNAMGTQVGGSGLLGSGEYTVEDGLLHAGGEYEWEVFSPGETALSTTIPEMQLSGKTIQVGPSFTRYHSIQSPQDFKVSTNVGVHQAAQGLFTRFWSMADVDDYLDPLPPELTPSPGTRIPALELEAYLRDAQEETCIGSRVCAKPNDPTCSSGFWRETFVLCGATHSVSLAPVSDSAELAGAHDDVDYNIEGRNVASTFSTTLTRDLAGKVGFSFSTAGKHGITAGFGLRSAFAIRGLGTLRVPETGTYVFGTRSSGGARLYLYDSSDDDLGKTLVSDGDAWVHPPLTNDCLGESNRVTYQNKLDRWESPWNSPNTYYYYEYDEDDHSWWQPEEADFDLARERLHENCAIDTEIHFGEPIHLEAGRDYPVQFDAWYGPIEGRLEVHVTRPSGQTVLLPFTWLQAADESTIDFDRRIEPAPPVGAKVEGSAFAMSGVGHSMAVIDPTHGLRVHEANGLGGWTNPVSLTLDGASFGNDGIPVLMQLDPYAGQVAGLPGPGGTGEFVLGPDGATLRSKLVMRSYHQGNGVEDYGTAEIDALEFSIDSQGQAVAIPILTGTVSGTVHFRTVQNGQTIADETYPLEQMGGFVDRNTGVVQLEMRGPHPRAQVRLVMGPDQADERELSTDPATAKFSTPINNGPTFTDSRLGTFVESTPGQFELGGEIFIHHRRLLMDGFCDPMGWCEDPIYTHRYLDIDGFAFGFSAVSHDAVRPIVALNASGTIRIRTSGQSGVTEAIQSATGTFNVATGDLDVEFVGANESVTMTLTAHDYAPSQHTFHESAVAMDDLGTTIVIAPDRVGPLEADAFIVSKIDNCEPFSDENKTVTSVGAALDEAGIPRPYASLPAYISELPTPADPSVTTQNLFANNPNHVGRILENDYAYLEWTVNGELAVRSVEDGDTFWSSNTEAENASLAWQGDGHLVIYSGGSAIWASQTHSAPRGHTLRLIGTQAVILSESGVVRWSTPPGPGVPMRGVAPQSVKITPDGRTIAIQQPTEAGLRIDVLDRATPESPWIATGSFPIDGSETSNLATELPSNVFALGSDAPPFELPKDYCWAPDPRPYTTRFLAYPSNMNGDSITIRSQGFAGQPWMEVAELDGHSDVTSMAFDHWSDNLAIGEPDKQQVTIYTRPNWWDAGGWELTKRIQPNAEPDFGAKVEYTFGVLAVSDREVVRFYRRIDTSSDAEWQDYGDWATFVPRGQPGSDRHVAFSLAGDSVTVLTAAAQLQHARANWFDPVGTVDDVDNFRR